MSRAAWLAVIAAILLVLGITAWIVAGLFQAPVYSLQARACIGCVETHTRQASSVRAASLTGDYRFRRSVEYVIRFGAGEVAYEGDSLEPGCHVGTAERGDTVSFAGATDVRFQAPAPENACA
jgi:hypothetical protein